MSDHPILFSAPMIRALLDGRKTQTRRILKPQPGPCEHKPYPSAADEFVPSIDDDGLHCAQCGNGIRIANTKSGVRGIPMRFRKGDRLWVRETLRRRHANDVVGETWLYSADQEVVNLRHGDPRIPDMIAWAHHKEGDTCVSIHMPRWASRLTLTVTDVRVQRLQDISEADAEAEGAYLDDSPCDHSRATCEEIGCLGQTFKAGFCNVWSLINGTPSWLANPWIVALTFTVERRNVDAARAA